jgi:hypothetical protein
VDSLSQLVGQTVSNYRVVADPDIPFLKQAKAEYAKLQ